MRRCQAEKIAVQLACPVVMCCDKGHECDVSISSKIVLQLETVDVFLSALPVEGNVQRAWVEFQDNYL